MFLVISVKDVKKALKLYRLKKAVKRRETKVQEQAQQEQYSQTEEGEEEPPRKKKENQKWTKSIFVNEADKDIY